MELIKELKQGNWTLKHTRGRDDYGFLRDYFEMIQDTGGQFLHRPFHPPIKVQDYNATSDIMDCTTDYTEKEYELMLRAQVTAHE